MRSSALENISAYSDKNTTGMEVKHIAANESS